MGFERTVCECSILVLLRVKLHMDTCSGMVLRLFSLSLIRLIYHGMGDSRRNPPSLSHHHDS